MECASGVNGGLSTEEPLMNKVRLIGCLVALGLILGGAVSRADDPGPDYLVVVKRAEVLKTKADGKSWDVNDGKPDLAVIVRNLDVKDSKYETKVREDTFAAEFNELTTLKVRKGQTVEFEVVDKDLAVDDSAGKVKRKMTAKMLE